MSAIGTPSASSTSAEPEREEAARLPCLATAQPQAAATSAAVVEMLNVPEPSPPVPAVSTRSSRAGAHLDDVRAHRPRRADELVDGLALGAQRDQQARDLRGVGLAAHHEPDRGLGVSGAQRVAGQQAVDRLGDHAALPMARKFRAITSPAGVSTDSGWNCTPCRCGMSRWRSAMTSPSRSRAVAISASGSGSIAASEW